jgi:hypothetical protein
MKTLPPHQELVIRSKISQADDAKPKRGYSAEQRACHQELLMNSRAIAYELHVAALAGETEVDFGFPPDYPQIIVSGYLSRAFGLLKKANLKAPKVVNPVSVR